MEYLYHVTNKGNLASIKEHGFAPPCRRPSGTIPGATEQDKRDAGNSVLEQCCKSFFFFLYQHDITFSRITAFPGNEIPLPAMAFTGEVTGSGASVNNVDREKLALLEIEACTKYLTYLNTNPTTADTSSSSSSSSTKPAKKSSSDFKSTWQTNINNFIATDTNHFILKFARFYQTSHYQAEEMVTHQHIYLFSEPHYKKNYGTYSKKTGNGNITQVATLRILKERFGTNISDDPSQGNALISKLTILAADITFVCGLLESDVVNSSLGSIWLDNQAWQPLSAFQSDDGSSSSSSSSSSSTTTASVPGNATLSVIPPEEGKTEKNDPK